MSQGAPPPPGDMPTDPSLEFDVFEMVRLRLVEALAAAGHDLIEAERLALYAVEVARPASNLLKVATRAEPPSHGELLEALSRVIAEVGALEKARRIMHRAGEGGGADG
jgi:hypothetical protein